MNRWARQHAALLECELEEDETLLGAGRVMIVAASSIASARTDDDDMGDRNERWLRSRADRLRHSAERGRGSRYGRLAVARELGLPLPGSTFVLGVSDRRLLIWRASTWLARPRELHSSVPIGEVAAIRAARRLGATRLAVLLDAGPMLVVQPLWSRGLSDLADAFASR